MATPSLPYEARSSVDWNRIAAETAAVRLIPDERYPEQIAVTGPCPRCGHETDWAEQLIVYTNLRAQPGRRLGVLGSLMRHAPAQQTSRDVEIICDCHVAHAGSDDESGCGASWVLTVAWGE